MESTEAGCHVEVRGAVQIQGETRTSHNGRSTGYGGEMSLKAAGAVAERERIGRRRYDAGPAVVRRSEHGNRSTPGQHCGDVTMGEKREIAMHHEPRPPLGCCDGCSGSRIEVVPGIDEDLDVVVGRPRRH